MLYSISLSFSHSLLRDQLSDSGFMLSWVLWGTKPQSSLICSFVYADMPQVDLWCSGFNNMVCPTSCHAVTNILSCPLSYLLPIDVIVHIHLLWPIASLTTYHAYAANPIPFFQLLTTPSTTSIAGCTIVKNLMAAAYLHPSNHTISPILESLSFFPKKTIPTDKICSPPISF